MMNQNQIIVLKPLDRCDQPFRVQSLLRDLLVSRKVDNVLEKFLHSRTSFSQNYG